MKSVIALQVGQIFLRFPFNWTDVLKNTKWEAFGSMFLEAQDGGTYIVPDSENS